MLIYLSYTATLLTACPVALVPVPVTVRVFPSAEMTAVCLTVGLPLFLYCASSVVALLPYALSGRGLAYRRHLLAQNA
jgi:hypothetical protein